MKKTWMPCAVYAAWGIRAFVVTFHQIVVKHLRLVRPGSTGEWGPDSKGPSPRKREAARPEPYFLRLRRHVTPGNMRFCVRWCPPASIGVVVIPGTPHLPHGPLVCGSWAGMNC